MQFQLLIKNPNDINEHEKASPVNVSQYKELNRIDSIEAEIIISHLIIAVMAFVSHSVVNFQTIPLNIEIFFYEYLFTAMKCGIDIDFKTQIDINLDHGCYLSILIST